MAYNKIVFAGSTLIDLTSDTVTADSLLKGATAHDKAGNTITGTAELGGAPLMLYAGGEEYTALTGGWTKVNGTLNKNPTYMQYYSGSAGTARFAATAKDISFAGKKKLVFRCRKDGSSGTASFYTVGLSTARGSGIVAEYSVRYSATNYNTVEIDLAAIDLSKSYYVFIKSAGAVANAVYIAAAYAE